jgi:pyruvate formate lyase activating enzyme
MPGGPVLGVEALEAVEALDVFDVQTYALHDGPGIRTAVFLRGCPLRCAWCHNPEAWARSPGLSPTTRSVDELVEAVLADGPFFDASGGGVTFTGGEPTVQRAAMVEAARRLRQHGVHVALETCGEFPTSACEELVEVVDLFLFDVKHLEPDAHRAGTGGGPARIQANLERLVELAGPARVVPRVPVIPGFNATPAALTAIVERLEDLGFDGEVHLLAYHGWARTKYEELGLAYEDRPALDDATRGALDAVFEGRRLCPVWGGGT